MRPSRLIKPSRFPFYYGWFLLPFAIIGVLMSMPGQTAGFSAFTEPLLKMTGFTRTRLSFCYMAGTIMSGFLLPAAGRRIDTLGVRAVMIVSSLLLALTLLAFSFLDAFGALLPIAPQLGYTLILVLLIFALRFFGQGLLPMSSNTMVGKWFDAKRGRAFAFMGVINTLAFSAAPAILAALVLGVGAKDAWRLLALIVGGGMSLIAWLFFFDTPESCGLPVDGYVHEREGKSGEIRGVTRARAIRSWTFWAVITVIAAHALVATGLSFHIQAIGSQAGMTLARAVAIFIPVSFISVPVSFISALLTERFRARYFVLCMAASQIVGYTSIYFLDTRIGYIVTIIGLGFSGGLMGTIQSAVIPKLFGRLHLGSINGTVTSAMVLSSALGPILLSSVNDMVGSLRLGISLMVILPVLAIILLIPSWREGNLSALGVVAAAGEDRG